MTSQASPKLSKVLSPEASHFATSSRGTAKASSHGGKPHGDTDAVWTATSRATAWCGDAARRWRARESTSSAKSVAARTRILITL